MRKIFGVEIWKLAFDVLLGFGLGLLIGSIYENNWGLVIIDLMIIAHIILSKEVVELGCYIGLLEYKIKKQQIEISEIKINCLK